MDGLPKGHDIADLVESGITGQALVDWFKARVKPGPPVLTKEEAKELSGRGSKAVAKRPVDIPKRKAAFAGSAVPDPALEPEPEPPPALDLPHEFSEDMLADEFTRRFHKTLAYCAPWERWLQWDDNRWVHDDTHLAVDLSRRVCRDAAALIQDRLEITPSKRNTMANIISSRRCFSAVEGIARSDRRHVVRPSQFDADPWIINTPDGIIDLTTGKMRRAKRNDWCVSSVVGCLRASLCFFWRCENTCVMHSLTPHLLTANHSTNSRSCQGVFSSCLWAHSPKIFFCLRCKFLRSIDLGLFLFPSLT